MLDAIESAMAGGMSGNKAAAKHGVPPSTLKDHLSGCVKHGTKPGPVPYLSQTEEKELTDHLLLASQSGYGKTHQDVMCIYIVEGDVYSGRLCKKPESFVHCFNF